MAPPRKPSPRLAPTVLGLLGAATVGSLAPLAWAEERASSRLAATVPTPDEDANVSGIESPKRGRGDVARAVANGLLFVPRNLIDYAFHGAELAATLVADRQLVPRYRELLGRPNAELIFFPTLFAETGTPLSVGARMIFDSPKVATSQRIGVGGREQVEAESRIVLKGRIGGRPAVLSLEALYLLQDNAEYHGIGLVPRTDPRNRFVAPDATDFGYYTERRVRGIASGGLRLGENVELLVSTSLYRRQLASTTARGGEAIDAVFTPGSVPGLSAANPFTSYTEFAARVDTRAVRTRPSPGWQLETYAGGATRVGDGPPTTFARMGTRAAFGVPVYRKQNLATFRVAVERVVPGSGTTLPFTELAHFPEFRGFDTRRDAVALLGAFDYTWQVVPFLGLRFFIDGVTVAPSIAAFGPAQLVNMRFATGFGLDTFAGPSTLASFAVSASGDGLRVVATFGGTQGYGDRQHRK